MTTIYYLSEPFYRYARRSPVQIRVDPVTRRDRELPASGCDKLSAGEPVSLSAGDQHQTLEIPARPTFEVKAERETDSSGANAERSLELEIEWDENGSEAGESGSLSIE